MYTGAYVYATCCTQHATDAMYVACPVFSGGRERRGGGGVEFWGNFELCVAQTKGTPKMNSGPVEKTVL